MTDFAWGVIAPFLALASLAICTGAGWLLVAVARHLWGSAHYALMGKAALRRNLAVIQLKGEPAETKPEFLDAANQFRDALLESPRMYTLAGLGWRVLFVRETRDADTSADTDEVLA